MQNKEEEWESSELEEFKLAAFATRTNSLSLRADKIIFAFCLKHILPFHYYNHLLNQGI